MANLIEIWIWNSYTWIYLLYKYVIILNIFLSFPAFWGSFKEKFVFKSTKYQISDSDHTLLKQLCSAWDSTDINPCKKFARLLYKCFFQIHFIWGSDKIYLSFIKQPTSFLITKLKIVIIFICDQSSLI